MFRFQQPANPSIRLRFAQASDAEALTHWLMQPSAQVGFACDSAKEVEDCVRQWIPICLDQCGIVAEQDGVPIGLVNIARHPFVRMSHQALLSIIVAEEHRGQGIGAILLENLISLACAHGLEMLHLEVHEGNPARRLYERMGFQEVGVQPAFIKESNGELRGKIIMERPLDPLPSQNNG